METDSTDRVASARGNRSARGDYLQEYWCTTDINIMHIAFGVLQELLWQSNFLRLSISKQFPTHLSFLPEEVNQLMIRGSPLGQQVLGVVGEGKGNNLSAGSWRTMTCDMWNLESRRGHWGNLQCPELSTSQQLHPLPLLQVKNHLGHNSYKF